MCTWKAETPFRVPAGARISAGKSGNVAMSLPKWALDVVKRSPVSCMPSPESPANRTMTWSSCSVCCVPDATHCLISFVAAVVWNPGSLRRALLHPCVSRTHLDSAVCLVGHSAYPPGADAPGRGHRRGSPPAGWRRVGNGSSTAISPGLGLVQGRARGLAHGRARGPRGASGDGDLGVQIDVLNGVDQGGTLVQWTLEGLAS